MLIGAFSQYFFGFTIFILSCFLVLLVLVQRGRGGGLTGALGGPGGQSAFGTKAGDLFTRITIGVAAAWIILCASAVFMLRGRGLPETGGVDRPVVKSDAGAGSTSSGGTSGTTTGAGEASLTPPKTDLPAAAPAGGLLQHLLPTCPAATPAATGSTPTTPASPESASPATPAATTPADATTPPATDAPAAAAPLLHRNLRLLRRHPANPSNRRPAWFNSLDVLGKRKRASKYDRASQGRRLFDQSEISVEVRAVNNRFLKIQTRVNDALAGLESQIEGLVKQSLRRGSLQVNVYMSERLLAASLLCRSRFWKRNYHQCNELAQQLGVPSA